VARRAKPGADTTLSELGYWTRMSKLLLFDTRLSAVDRLVYEGLISYANRTTAVKGDASIFSTFVGSDTLAARLGFSTRGVADAIGKLQELGFIERTLRGQGKTAVTELLPLDDVYPSDIKKLRAAKAKKDKISVSPIRLIGNESD